MTARMVAHRDAAGLSLFASSRANKATPIDRRGYCGTWTVKKACGTRIGAPLVFVFLMQPLNQPGNRLGWLLAVTSRWTEVPVCWRTSTASVIAEVVPRLIVH